MKLSSIYTHRWKLAVALVLASACFIRFFRLDALPPGLYWEEVALGYDAYSILTTGRDHRGQLLPLLAFESFSDFKPPVYFYALVPSIAIFGLNEWAVRIPSALAGIALVWGVGELVSQVFYTLVKPHHIRRWRLVGLGVVTISPWAIMFSRAAWEVNLATALLVWAICWWWRTLDTKTPSLGINRYHWLSVISLVLSMYTYHALRVIAPLVGLGLVFLSMAEWGRAQKKNRGYFSNWLAHAHVFYKKSKLQLASILIVALSLSAPLLVGLNDPAVTKRFDQTNIFSNTDIIVESNAKRAAAGNSLVSRVLYHRWVLYGREFLYNYGSHLSFQFLFVSGDKNPRHSVQTFGHLYHIEAVFLLFGITQAIKSRNRFLIFLVYWWAIALIPSAMTYGAPHGLRTLPALPVLMVLITIGIWRIVSFLTKKTPQLKQILITTIAILYTVEFLSFWRAYTTTYAETYKDAWQYGYAELIPVMERLQKDRFPHPVYITREYGRPAMYYWFYTRANAHSVQASTQAPDALQDNGEFLGYETIRFIGTVSEITTPDAVVASTPEGRDALEALGAHTTTTLKEITDDRAGVIWEVYEIKKNL